MIDRLSRDEDGAPYINFIIHINVNKYGIVHYIFHVF